MTHLAYRSPTVGTLLALVALLWSPTASAQWVEPPGAGWVQLQVSHQQTEEGFDENGEVVPLIQTPGDEGESIISTVRVTGALGLVQGLDAWLDVPFHRQEFNSSNAVTEDLLDTGFGDPRVYLRIGPSLFGADALPVGVALRGGAKFTSNNFSVSSETISLSEGQRDWEMLLELGKSLHPWPVYVQGWTGYRWRERNDEIERDPGNEWLFYAAAGGNLERLQWKLAVDGLFGQRSSRSAAAGRLEFPGRELVQIVPRIGWRVGPGAVQAHVRVPVHGQSTRANQLPAAPTFTVGYFLTWSRSLWAQ